MQQHLRLILAEARAEARAAGMEVTLQNTSRRHPKLILSRGDKKLWRFTVPSSPRDADQAINTTRHKVRRKIEELGA